MRNSKPYSLLASTPTAGSGSPASSTIIAYKKANETVSSADRNDVLLSSLLFCSAMRQVRRSKSRKAEQS